ncbi:MAG: hypothetical protein IJ011_04685 [Clostridia bacterium]|nr:hypothetical protein [Clostridia bacterium]
MKKNIFRIFALALAAMLTLCVFVACDNSSGDGEDEAKAGVYAIEYNGTKVELGKKADSALSALGEPISAQNTGNCGGLGETIRYDYSAFVMVVVDYEDGDKIIDQIELKNDGAETSKGIYIGSSEADVKSAYGDADSTSGSALVYEDNGKHLEIGITDGAVSSIVLRCVG